MLKQRIAAVTGFPCGSIGIRHRKEASMNNIIYIVGLVVVVVAVLSFFGLR
jgi:hypothetical protein